MMLLRNNSRMLLLPYGCDEREQELVYSRWMTQRSLPKGRDRNRDLTRENKGEHKVLRRLGGLRCEPSICFDTHILLSIV